MQGGEGKKNQAGKGRESPKRALLALSWKGRRRAGWSPTGRRAGGGGKIRETSTPNVPKRAPPALAAYLPEAEWPRALGEAGVSARKKKRRETEGERHERASNSPQRLVPPTPAHHLACLRSGAAASLRVREPKLLLYSTVPSRGFLPRGCSAPPRTPGRSNAPPASESAWLPRRGGEKEEETGTPRLGRIRRLSSAQSELTSPTAPSALLTTHFGQAAAFRFSICKKKWSS